MTHDYPETFGKKMQQIGFRVFRKKKILVFAVGVNFELMKISNDLFDDTQKHTALCNANFNQIITN